MKAKSTWPFKIGLLLVAFSWFSFNFYEFTLGIFSRHTSFPIVTEDIAGVWGLGLRVAAGFIAIITILLYFKKDISKPEAIMALRIIIIFEAAYFLSFFAGVVWRSFYRLTIPNMIEAILPSLVQSITIPVVLAKLFLELSPNKPTINAVKWGMITGVVYLFVYWFTNTAGWVGAVWWKGFSYVVSFPVNLFSFTLTVIGLLALTFSAAYFWKKSPQKEVFGKSDFRKIGILITVLGLYYNLIYVLWLFFGSVGGWSTWYSWFLGHGNLWTLSLPLVGLPLLFSTPVDIDDVKLRLTRGLVRKKHLTLFLFLAQGIGLVFYIVFSAAYIIPLPSTQVLTGEPVFHLLLSIFGGLFLIFTLFALTISALSKRSDELIADYG